MVNWINITKEQFDAAYNKHLPSGWIKFAYKYFSKETENEDMEVKSTITYILGWLFILGMLAAMLKLSDKIIGMFLIPYSILLAVLVLYLFSAVFLNNFRIGKIRKELGVTKEQYDVLLRNFYS